MPVSDSPFKRPAFISHPHSTELPVFPGAVTRRSGAAALVLACLAGGLAPRRLQAQNIITTVAGNGTYFYNGDNIPATSAALYRPTSVAVDSAGNLYIADFGHGRIRRVNATSGIITTVAGDGTYGFSGDGGAATAAKLYAPMGVALDGSGNLYIADTANNRIRRVDTSGIITTVAGNGTEGYNGDNIAALSAALNSPISVAVDSAGNLYIGDWYNCRVRKVDSTGMITTVAGNGTYGFSGDGGAATSANIGEPTVAVDSAGNLYIADVANNRIRRVNAISGIITTVAGHDGPGFSGDGGAATAANLSTPSGVALDSTGMLYISDEFNARIRRVDTSGIITTVAGNGTQGYNGDNIAALSAALYWPFGVALDSAGNLYIADMNNYRIRKVALGDFSLGAIAPITLFVGGSGSTQVPVNSLNGFNSAVALSVSGMPNGLLASFSSTSVTPPADGSTSSTLNLSLSPKVTPSTIPLTVTGTYGTLTHSTVVSVTVKADISSIINLIGQLSAVGCIDNSGISNALIQKLVAAQTAISAGDGRTASNTLNALLQQLSAQGGKHISTTCTVDGTTFNPVTVLISEVSGFIASLKASTVDPLVGYVVNSTGHGVSGATVTVFDSSNNAVASAVTDPTGFYFFATTGVLNIGSTYTAAVTGLPVGYTTSSPPQTLTWNGTVTILSNFTVN